MGGAPLGAYIQQPELRVNRKLNQKGRDFDVVQLVTD